MLFNNGMNIAEKSRKALEFDKIKEELANFAKTNQSRELCLALEPSSDIVRINKSLKCTREAKFILDIPSEIPIEFVANITEIKNHIGGSFLSEEELIDVAKTLKTSRLIKKFLNDNLEENSLLKNLTQNLIVDRELEEKIFDTFDENLNVRPDATAELKGLYSALKDNEKNLRATVSSLLNSSEFSKHLQENIYTTRDDRIVFQVMASSKNKVAGIIHDVSATNKTFYIEPQQIVPLNNKIREIKSNIHSEIIKILTGLTNLVKDEIKLLEQSEKTLAEIDFHFAKARYAVRLQAVEPEIVTHKIIEFENMRHPLLNVENVVTNNFEIGKTYKSVIITGSNTGGKTVTIKTLGLFILMAEAGMFLPCTMAKIYPFEKVYADIGDDQSILQNLSTFSSHMTHIIDILNTSNSKTFVLLDEICAGTDPTEGAVLARVILEKLAQKEVMSTITTHYGELKALEYSNPYFKNASVEFDTETLKPTYKLLIGIPGLSNAIAIASNLGLDEDLAQKAKNILISSKDPSILVVEKLQETQAKLEKNLQETEIIKETSQNIKSEYETSLEAVKKDKKKAVKTIKDKFDRELLSVKAEIKDILEELRREKSEKIARRSYARLAQTEQKFREKLSEYDEKQKYAEIDWNNVKEGDKLILKELNQPVTLLSLPDKNGYTNILMGNIKTKIKRNKLAPYDEIYERKENVYKPKSFENFELRRINIASTLDLRGYKVEEALDSLESYLDKASLANLACVTVIHGHGTGALKSAVRDFLSTSPYVAKFRAGEDSEGGDGVSVIDIN